MIRLSNNHRSLSCNIPVKPRSIHDELDKRVYGLDVAKQFISTRIAMHAARAVEIREKREIFDKNQCLLLLGPSGCGKTFLVEQAAQIVKLPFLAVSSASLTSEGYVGQGLSDVLGQLRASAGDSGVPARFGILFLDEWDKRVAPAGDNHTFSRGIQGEMLRIMEGTSVQISNRPPVPPAQFDTRGLMFIFAGAFSDLRLTEEDRPSILGFGGPPSTPSGRTDRKRALREALEDYGMMPEFLNRLSGIMTLPTPTLDDMRAMMAFENGPLAECNRRLRKLGLASMALEPKAMDAVAAHACDTKSYSRGIQMLLQRAMDLLVYENVKGEVLLQAGDIERLRADLPLELPPPPPGGGPAPKAAPAQLAVA